MLIESTKERITKQIIIDSPEMGLSIDLEQEMFAGKIGQEEYYFELKSARAEDDELKEVEYIITVSDGSSSVLEIIPNEYTVYPIAVDIEGYLILPRLYMYSYTPFFDNAYGLSNAVNLTTGETVATINKNSLDNLEGTISNNTLNIKNKIYIQKYKTDFYSTTPKYTTKWYESSSVDEECIEIPEFENMIAVSLINANDYRVRLYGIFIEEINSLKEFVLRQTYIYADIDKEGKLYNINKVVSPSTYTSSGYTSSEIKLRLVYQDEENIGFNSEILKCHIVNSKKDIFNEPFVLANKKADSIYKNNYEIYNCIYINVTNAKCLVRFHSNNNYNDISIPLPEGYSKFESAFVCFEDEYNQYLYVDYDISYSKKRLDKYRIDITKEEVIFVETIFEENYQSRIIKGSDKKVFAYSIYPNTNDYTILRSQKVWILDDNPTIDSTTSFKSLRQLIKRSSNSINTYRTLDVNNEYNIDANRNVTATSSRRVLTNRSFSINYKVKLNLSRQITNLDYNTGKIRRTILRDGIDLGDTKRSVLVPKVSLYNTSRAIFDGSTITINAPIIRIKVNNSSSRYPYTLRQVSANHITIADASRRAINDYSYNYHTRRLVFNGTVETVEAPTIRAISINDSITEPTRRLTGNLVTDSFYTKRAMYIHRDEAALYNINVELSGIVTF